MSSGFNLLSLKKEDKKDVKTNYCRHLVVGDDLFSVALYVDLKKKLGDSETAFICDKDLVPADLSLMGPNTLRGEANIEKFKRFYPDVSLDVVESPSEFFKELRWRPFGGRAKSEKLLWNEEFYTHSRADFAVESLFPFLKEESFFEMINNERRDIKVKSLKRMIPDDLAEPANFELELSNGDLFKCEHLYWGGGPQSFLNTYADKKELSNEFIEFCEEATAPSALYVRLEFEKEITDKRETLFIPLSYTHEWGHFVGEFMAMENGRQAAEFVTFMDMDHTNEDEISKKIRLLKKNIEKIFGEVARSTSNEFIKLTDTSPCLKIDDGLFLKVKEDWKNLSMLSFNAPMEKCSESVGSFEDSVMSVSFLARAAYKHVEILNTVQ